MTGKELTKTIIKQYLCIYAFNHFLYKSKTINYRENRTLSEIHPTSYFYIDLRRKTGE